MITLSAVTKSYGATPTVRDLSLTIAKGELFVLIGPSGCGKSTTLRLINRLITPESGTIAIDGQDTATIPETTLRRRIGYAIQAGGLFPHWTVAQNIAAVPRLLGWDRPRIDRRIDELLSLLSLPLAFRTKKPRELSGGQAQRVTVARALAADPPLLLMDEPFGALDPPTRETLQRDFRHIQQTAGKTVVLVTHDMDEAITLADRIGLMRDGALVQTGAPADLLQHPADAFVEQFLGGATPGLRRLAALRVRDRYTPGNPPDAPAIDADASLRDALATMQARNTPALAVTEQGRPAGIIRAEDLVR